MSYYSKCVDCREEFTEDQCMKVNCCPSCGSEGIPMAEKDDVQIKINWQELRILSMWAENWAAYMFEKDPANPVKVTVDAITQALEEQFPSRLPLTLARELGDVKEDFPDVEVVGLIQPESRKKVH